MHLAVSLLGYAPPVRPWQGDYCAGILPALLKDPGLSQATLLVTPYGRQHWTHLESERIRLRLVEGLDERKRRRFYAERYILPGMLRELSPDAVFAPLGGALLQPNTRYIYRLASLAFLEEPERFSMLEQLFYGKTIPASCKAADAVVVDHEVLAGSVASRGITSRDRVHMIEPGADGPPAAPESADAAKAEADLDESGERTAEQPGRATISGKYVVCFAGETDVQLPRLLSGLLQHARLPRDWDYATFICLGRLAGQVRGPRLLAVEDAPAEVYWSLLHGAAAALSLSTSDSAVTSVRHAQSEGLPLIVADTPVARAVAGEAAVYVPPYELADTASALAVLLGDEPQRRELSESARRRSNKHTWPQTAGRLMELLTNG
jgi:glycosyltransferase involved in cell wall biosynthesis